ncbi:GroES-like protein, partial [Trichodelitschia bisporula]
MKEAIVSPDLSVKIVDSPVPTPGEGQYLIKVVVSGSNPKDWKVPHWTKTEVNSGDDIAGTIVSAHPSITAPLPKGTRVAAFHTMVTPAGSFAEYALASAATTFPLPPGTSFEEGATIPLAALTAAVALFGELALPMPWAHVEDEKKGPLVVYGASTAVGAFAIKIAKWAGIGPIYTVAGRATEWARGLIDESKGDIVVDYREGADKVVDAIKKAAGGKPILHALDAISEQGSIELISRVLADGARLTLVLPPKDGQIPDRIKWSRTSVGVVTDGVGMGPPSKPVDVASGLAYSQLFTRGLEKGWLTGHPFEVVPGGLGGVEKALKDLKDGKASAVKYVFRVGE